MSENSNYLVNRIKNCDRQRRCLILISGSIDLITTEQKLQFLTRNSSWLTSLNLVKIYTVNENDEFLEFIDPFLFSRSTTYQIPHSDHSTYLFKECVCHSQFGPRHIFVVKIQALNLIFFRIRSIRNYRPNVGIMLVINLPSKRLNVKCSKRHD